RQRLLDDLEAAPRLGVRVGRWVGVVRHQRRRPGYVHERTGDDRAAVAVPLLPARARRDEAALHPSSIAAVEALKEVDSWPAPNAAVAVVAPDGVAAARGERDREFRWASIT